MYELLQVAPRTYYIQSPAKIGLYVDEAGNATLIDTGNDKEAGRKINQHLNNNSWTLKTILNTHSNADHIGGNAFLQQRADCKILSTEIENLYTKHPYLEPSFLYGGYPPAPLRNKFLMAQPSIPTSDIMESAPEGFEIVSLPGHYFDMIGVRTPDDILFLGDCLSGAHIVEKYHVNFIYDVAKYLETLDTIETLDAKLYIPAHAEPVEEIHTLAALNRNKVLEIIALIVDLCGEEQTTEELLKRIFDHYGLQMDFNQHVLVGSTARSYLAYLLDHNRVAASFEGNRLTWKSV